MGKLEDTFNLPETIQSLEDNAESIKDYFDDSEKNTDIETYQEKVTVTMEEFADLSDYEKEMNEISDKTLTEFSDIVSLAKDVETRHAGEFFSAAAQMAKISLDARNNKMTAKLKLLELQLRKQRNDLLADKQKATLPEDDNNENVESKELTRDELLEIAESLKKT